MSRLFSGLSNNQRNAAEYINEFIQMESPALETRIPILAAITSALPLLGILGTVLGIIDSISFLENSSYTNFQGVWKGIWFALSTTAAALSVAIPSLFAYNYLLYKINAIFSYIKKETMFLINQMHSADKSNVGGL